MSKLRTGARTPFFASNITHYVSIATANFSPIDDQPAALTATQEEVFTKSGFLVKNATDTAGLVYVVTWEEYEMHRLRSNETLLTNVQILALCTPVAAYLTSGQWLECPVVKVYADNNQSYPSTVVTINVGTIR